MSNGASGIEPWVLLKYRQKIIVNSDLPQRRTRPQAAVVACRRRTASAAVEWCADHREDAPRVVEHLGEFSFAIDEEGQGAPPARCAAIRSGTSHLDSSWHGSQGQERITIGYPRMSIE